MKKIVFGFFLLGLLGCTREKTTTTLNIKLPSSDATQSDVVHTKGTGFNTLLNPTTVADINCYAIFVGGPEATMSQNNCYDTSTNTVKMKFGPSRYFIPAGTETSIEVPSGPSRQIYLVGLKSQGTACSPLGVGQNPDSSNMSVPHIVSEKVVDLQSGETSVEMVRTIDTNKKFDNCSFMSGGGGSSLNLFGNGRDGNFNVTALAQLTFGSASYSSDPDLGHSGSSLSAPTTKMAGATRWITNVNTATGSTVTLDSAYTVDDFEVGDEVIWYVSSAWAPTNPDDNGCGTGSSLYRGKFGFANVVGTPSSTVLTLDKSLSAAPSTINNANLAQANPVTGTPFCRIHVTRVPNFNTITVAATQTLNFSVLPFNMAGGGGVIAFRVNEIVLNSGSIFNIKTDGMGFNSATNTQGDGVQGKGSASANPNHNGAGSGNAGGGGGGSADGGNSGGSTVGQKGSGVLFCVDNNMTARPCLAARDQKSFFGGGGGGAGAGPGGFGGGIVIIHAKKISGTGTLNITSNGVAGSSGTGGGGGGSVSLTTQQIASTVTTVISSNGGNGSSGTYTGGGGGGGVTEVKYCGTLSSTTGITATATGGAGNVSGANAPANAQEILDVPALCSAN